MTIDQKLQITCFLFPDLPPWEKEGVDPLIRELSGRFSLRLIEVRAGDKGRLKKTHGVSWILSKNWERSLRFLGSTASDSRVFVSLFGIPNEKRALPLLFWKRLSRAVPENVNFIAHSPLNYRFFREIEAFPDTRVSFLHLPFSVNLAERFSSRPNKSSDGFRVGTFAPFVSTSNLNYFLNVAHYVVARRNHARFRIFGWGELYGHLYELVKELGLDDHVTVVESLTADEIDGLDLLLFTPLRNDHFLPVLTAAAARLPVLASEVPGISDLIENGKSGFIFPVNQTAPMGEATIRLLDHALLRRSMSEELKKSVAEKFSTSLLADKYASLFFSIKGPVWKELQKDPSRAA
jgi:glycosyltransferase involved in cell wall biosynthesis